MQASVRALAIGAGIDFSRRYKDQSITKLAKLMVAASTCPKRVPSTNIKQAREAELYLARFDDWATGQIIRQYINGKQKYENAKANGKVKVGEKRQRISAASTCLASMTMRRERALMVAAMAVVDVAWTRTKTPLITSAMRGSKSLVIGVAGGTLEGITVYMESYDQVLREKQLWLQVI